MISLSPNIFTTDIKKTVEFYQLLGFELLVTNPPDGEYIWAMMKNGAVTFMFQTVESLGEELPAINRTPGGSLIFYIDVPDIQALFERIQHRVPVLKGLEKTFYGTTEFSILDVNGYVLTFAQDEAPKED